MNDARVIGRQLPPLSPLTHEVRGDPESSVKGEHRR